MHFKCTSLVSLINMYFYVFEVENVQINLSYVLKGQR